MAAQCRAFAAGHLAGLAFCVTREALTSRRAICELLVNCDDSRWANLQKFFALGSDFSSASSDLEFEDLVVMARIPRRHARDVDLVSADLRAAHDRQRVAERPRPHFFRTAKPAGKDPFPF
ncbi:enoyl reductase-like protein [Bradyrhizobium sp. i1.8.4]|uniref:hypothetical protein n=1 Tax=unclassified Bradyrhizobium TaxID=2631580 RepID=UPI003D23BCFD